MKTKKTSKTQPDYLPAEFLELPDFNRQLSQIEDTSLKGLESKTYRDHNASGTESGLLTKLEEIVTSEITALVHKLNSSVKSALMELKGQFNRLGREVRMYRLNKSYGEDSTFRFLQDERDQKIKALVEERQNSIVELIKTKEDTNKELHSHKLRLQSIELAGNYIPQMKRFALLGGALLILIVEALVFSSSLKIIASNTFSSIAFAFVLAGSLFMASEMYGRFIKRHQIFNRKFLVRTLLFVFVIVTIAYVLVFLRLKYFEISNITLNLPIYLLVIIFSITVGTSVALSYIAATQNKQETIEGNQIAKRIKLYNKELKQIETKIRKLDFEIRAIKVSIEMEYSLKLNEYEFPNIEKRLIEVGDRYNKLLSASNGFADQSNALNKKIISKYREHFLRLAGHSFENSQNEIDDITNPFTAFEYLDANIFIKPQFESNEASYTKPYLRQALTILILMVVLFNFGCKSNTGNTSTTFHIIELLDTSKSIVKPKTLKGGQIRKFAKLDVVNGVIPVNALKFSVGFIHETTSPNFQNIEFTPNPDNDELTEMFAYKNFGRELDTFIYLGNESNFMGQKTCFYASFCDALKQLKQNKAKRKVLIIFSDCREDCIIDFKNFKDSISIKTFEILQRDETFQENLLGIDIVFVYEPPDLDSDIEHRKVMRFWKKVLEPTKARVFIQGTLNLDELNY